MQKIPRAHFQSADLDRTSEVEQVGIGVRHRYIACKQMQSELADSRQLSHCTIGYVSHAPQSHEYRGVAISNQRSDSRGFVHILQNNDPRRGYLENAIPPIRPVTKPASYHRRLS